MRLRMTGVSLIKVFNKQTVSFISHPCLNQLGGFFSERIFNKVHYAGFTVDHVQQKMLRCHPSYREINTGNWSMGVRNQGMQEGWVALLQDQSSLLWVLDFFILLPDFTWVIMLKVCWWLQQLLYRQAEPEHVLQMRHHKSSDLLIFACPVNTFPVKRWSGGSIHEMKLGCLSIIKSTVKW